MRTIALALLVFLACADAGSRGRTAAGAVCALEPERAIQAFLVRQEIGNAEIRGTLIGVEELPDLEARNYRFRTDGREETLRWMSRTTLPLTVGTEYALRVDYFPGSPDASGLLIEQEGELRFAAITDQRPGQRALRDGIPGFEIEMLPSGCASRSATRCHESLVNVPVRVSYCDESLELYHGGSGRLCDAEVRLHVAQQVGYSRACADAGLPGISLTISR